MEQIAARRKMPCTLRTRGLVLVVILLWPSLLTAHPHSSHVNHRLVRRGATPPSPPSGSESPSGHTGAPPPEARQVEPPDGGRGNRGASPPGEAKGGGEEAGDTGKKEETTASTANLAQPVSDGTGGRVDGLHPGIIVVLSLVCVFLFVLLLVCTAALIRYTVVQRRKKGRLTIQKNVPRSGVDSDLWAEGARYSPATPQTLPNRKRTRNSKGQPHTDTTRASHISTELYRAVYPYSPTEDTQLRLEPGSVVDVVEKTEGWWRGYAGPKEGWFPANYVERVYQPDSCATLEDYTDDMGGRHSRHLRAERHTNRAGHTHHHTSTTLSITHSSRDSVHNRGLDEVDFQAGRHRSIQDRPIPLPPTAPLPDPEVEAAQPMVPKHNDRPAEDPTQEEDFSLRIPNSGSSGGEENLLQSIFNDLEKAWSKAQVSTPINKDYYKLEPLESSLQPIPLAESFGEDDSYYTKRHSAAGSHASSTPSPQQDQEEGVQQQQQSLEEADGGPIVEDTYINREEEIQRVEDEEDMYINCQAERHEAEKEEEAAQEEMEVVHHDFDKILQDCINREAATKEQEDPEPPVEPVSDSADVSYRALYSYVPRQPDELPIRADELLLHVSNISNDWVRVRNTSGEEGLVPLLYVSQKDPHSPSHQEAQTRHRSPETPDSEDWDINEFDNDIEGDITAIEYVAIYDYEPQQDGDLPLRVGDKVAVLEMHDNGWWKGLCMQQEGWFPGSYVEMSTLSSTPNTPAATALSPFASVLAQAINDAKDQTLVKTPVVPEEDDVPPPLPTCPPPTDEELEELERKLREQREQLEKEKASHQEESPLSSPQHVILPTRVTSKDNNSRSSSDEYLQPVPEHGMNKVERQKQESGLVKANGTIPVVDTQQDTVNKPVEVKTFVQVRPGPSGRPHATGYESDATTSSEIEASPPRPLVKPPVGFGGSDFGISSNDESEPERFRSKLAKRFGKPKFVKIPKKILPQVRRGGSMGKRTAPPAPEHRRLEISAPILQQTSDPMRIAASQELRVSFQEPIVEKSPEAKKAEAIAIIDPPHNDSPGILKNKPTMIYKSPHGGSYEDIVDKRSIPPNGDNHKCVPSRPNSRPVSQASNGSIRSNTPEGRSNDHSGRGHTAQRQRLPSVEAQPSSANTVTTQSSHSGVKRPNKTPPPRPRPISNTPMSVPHPSQKPENRPPLRQSVSLTSTPTVHHSSGAVYRQSSVGAPVQEELSPDLQPMKGRRRSHRPSAPPPPRPKMPPPPRPPGPPPGRVGAHGDGLHPDQKHSSGHNQCSDQWIELNGLDCSQTSAEIIMQPLSDRAKSQRPETMNNSVDSQKSSFATKGSLGGYVDLHESVQSAPADVTFTVNKVGARTNTKVKATSDPRYLVSSHLTESTDFDEVDGPESNFQVISMTGHSKRINAGPRDSFRKYKKQVGGGKRSSLNEATHQGVAPQARAQHKAKSQTLPTTATPSLMMEDDDDPIRNIGHYDMPRNLHYDVPRSLTLGRQEATVTGPTKRWSSPPTSPSRKSVPQRPPPPAVSPGSPVKKFPSGQNGDVQHANRAERPVKPPRKDKIRRSTESYLASEKGELSFEEDTVIRDIGEVSMTRSISTNASEPPRPSGDIVWI